MDAQVLSNDTLSSNPDDELMQVDVECTIGVDNGVQANVACGSIQQDTNFGDRGNSFTYIENDLYHFLNHPTNLQGRIILGRYKLSKQVDYARLKEMVISREIMKDPISYKIESEAFVALREQIIELFPTEDRDLLFVPYFSSPIGNHLSARGCLYNEYKFIRNQLRGAGLLTSEDQHDASKLNEDTREVHTTSVFLMNPHDYSTTEIIRRWEETFGQRHQLLVQSERKKKPVSTQQYVDSFPCLNQQLGVLLLESDFEEILNIHFKYQVNTKELLLKFKTLFVEAWPVHAEKVMKLCKSSRNKDVQNFLVTHKESVNAGNNNSVLALFLLPLCVSVIKSLKRKGSETKTYNKLMITNSFILHVQDPANFCAAKLDHETWLAENEIAPSPYVIFCGDIANITQVVGKEQFSFFNPLQAIETCFKCLTALRTVPHMCDYVWHLIHKIVYGEYGFTPLKCAACVTKFIVELHKL